jgi:hypothetical protein
LEIANLMKQQATLDYGNEGRIKELVIWSGLACFG